MIDELKQFTKQNFPAIMTGFAIGGIATTAFFAGKGALEADKRLRELESQTGRKLTYKETFKHAFPCFLPAVLAGLGTALCIVGTTRQSTKALAAAIAVANAGKDEVAQTRAAINEVFGDRGLRKVDEQINRENAAKYFENVSAKTIYETGKGRTLCCEGFLTGILFHASREWVRKTVNDFNARLIAGEALSFNEFVMMLIPDIDISILPASGNLWIYNLYIKHQLLEIVEDSFLTYDGSEPGYIFKLRELPIISTDEYY